MSFHLTKKKQNIKQKLNFVTWIHKNGKRKTFAQTTQKVLKYDSILQIKI